MNFFESQSSTPAEGYRLVTALDREKQRLPVRATIGRSPRRARLLHKPSPVQGGAHPPPT